MNRIFLTLAVVANTALGFAVWWGLSIQPGETILETTRHAVSMHLLVALGASLLILMMHAIVLTYFMGTGRWIEETATAYKLGDEYRLKNIRLKYRVIPAMVACMALVIITGAAGAMSDPIARGTASVASTIHFTLATLLVLGNLYTSWAEYQAIVRNGALVNSAVAEVKRIRSERGLK